MKDALLLKSVSGAEHPVSGAERPTAESDALSGCGSGRASGFRVVERSGD